jgi:membrane associated rhomboid family serine protease
MYMYMQVGPAGSILGIVAYFFVFLIFESPLLQRPWIECLKLVGVSGVLFLLGLIPYVDNWAHLGGFMFGFFISGVLVPYGDFKEVWLLTNQKKEDFKIYRNIKLVLIFVGLPVLVLLYTLFIVLLWVVQSTVSGFSFFTCVPLTDTLCIDQQVLIRDRDGIFIV